MGSAPAETEPATDTSRTLEFDSAHFLQSLFAHDESLLHLLGERWGLKATTRDGWLRLDGPAPAIERACALFDALEKARRAGSQIDEHTFRFALESIEEDGDDGGEAGAGRVASLLDSAILGTPRKPPVVPRTRGQLRYLHAIDSHPVVFGTGPAGTGKTYLAMAKALAALKAREVNRLILSRPAVEAGEALGFLPGDLEEKISPYLRPLYDALYDMLEPAEVTKFLERNMIEIAPLAYMRGRTLNRAFVILDEAQNTTEEQMFMFLTRIGEGTQCVVTGDPSQVDLRPHVRSGLREAMRILPGTEGVAFCPFSRDDVVRHPVVQRIIDAYSKARDPEGSGGGPWRPGETGAPRGGASPPGPGAAAAPSSSPLQSSDA